MNLEDIMPCEISQAQKKKTPSSHVECKKKVEYIEAEKRRGKEVGEMGRCWSKRTNCSYV